MNRKVSTAASCQGSSLKLQPHQIEKPWGRTEIPRVFGNTDGKRIGEIWFELPQAKNLPLLVKYIFTSEKLSIQVHPNDEEARARGLARGKSECWYILDAEPGATLGLGMCRTLTTDELLRAAVDGSIEELMDWRPVSAGEFFFVPPGTVHAIGAGISLLEFQQNAEVTYRLYDYGRPRELHLDDGVAVSRSGPYPSNLSRPSGSPLDTALVDDPTFSLVRASAAGATVVALEDRRRWVMPLEGSVHGGTDRAQAGECLLLDPGVPLEFSSDALALIGIEGRI